MPEQLSIRHWRQINNMTQQDVADTLRVSVKTVIEWEKENSNLKELVIYALAKLYDIEIDQIKV
ncbi:helix-turn-helix transcriptional regulator [Mammaliicoccus sciuri]|uniref:helix-turn-helix transcriptional regulator n=1 Tax=Mammaliicoccus sciuri TaxID=1296 RepID=UPI002DB80B21|nr:helix-turn-helix transcriptional regulator [Mammaliicoccus sciuri]MEB8265148.1 helix-turn-helix transcriptional regulator [Mammaliicoccus sciuri]